MKVAAANLGSPDMKLCSASSLLTVCALAVPQYPLRKVDWARVDKFSPYDALQPQVRTFFYYLLFSIAQRILEYSIPSSSVGPSTACAVVAHPR